MSKSSIILITVLIIVIVLWYLFRPERIFISKRVDEGFPETASVETAQSESSPKLIFKGNFHGVAHETKGIASIYELPDGKRVVRFTDFETSNGPDVRVYLIAAEDADDSETVKNAGFISLGSIKGNIGDQNYELPKDLDLSKYRALTIWCHRFGVNFGTAPLMTVKN